MCMTKDMCAMDGTAPRWSSTSLASGAYRVLCARREGGPPG
jgi:hypothetical protein